MKEKFNRLTEKFKQLKPSQKVECVIAFLLSLFLVVAIPAYAWFSSSHKMETLTKVQAPPALDIRAGNKHDIVNFRLSDIDLEKMAEDNGKKCYVFCVKSGEQGAEFKIQLAHTTNIPFEYKIYPARALTDGDDPSVYDVDYEYVESGVTKHTYYKKTDGAFDMTKLNPEVQADAELHGRELANFRDKTGYKDEYDGTDEPEIYVMAKYSQTEEITSTTDDYDFFILEVNFNGHKDDATPGFAKWNRPDNLKETDIIYISALKTS